MSSPAKASEDKPRKQINNIRYLEFIVMVVVIVLSLLDKLL